MVTKEVYEMLLENGIKPSVQRMAIIQYLQTHFNHPTVDDVYNGLYKKIPTLSRTTVYNSLRMLSEHHVAQMITIDDHHVCYDGNITPHVHFYCKECGKVTDLFNVQAPDLPSAEVSEGNMIDEVQLYYKGICKDCQNKKDNNN